MIAGCAHNGAPPPFDAEKWKASAAIFSKGRVQLQRDQHRTFCSWGPEGNALTPIQSVLLDGTIDNKHELCTQLNLNPQAGDCEIYGAAVERWGDEADRQIVGAYAAIVALPNGTFRLSRSPWNAPPLFWARRGNAVIASTTMRMLFAAGLPQVVKPGHYAAMLAWLEPEHDAHWYEGVHKCPQGEVLRVDQSDVRKAPWYCPDDIPQIRGLSDDEYVEKADELLRQAVSVALARSTKPGILLSGGLDSSLVTDEILRQQGDQPVLHSFTFTPRETWHGHMPAGSFANDAPWVRKFAEGRGGLHTHFTDNAEHGFDAYAEQFLVSTQTLRPANAISSVFRGPAQLAKAQGCDWLFAANFGNNTFSNDGRWGYVEFLQRGKLIELWNMLKKHPGDDRPMLRRFLARSVLMIMPGRVRQAVRRALHGQAQDLTSDTTLLRPAAIDRIRARAADQESGGWRSGEWFRSHREWLNYIWNTSDQSADMHTGMEEVFSMRFRDITAYRPLIEFCAGIPTEQFVRNGQQRWLARRMAKGRMPEAQRLNTDYGLHHADWHHRLKPRLGEIKQTIETIKRDPELDALIDTDEAMRRIENFPIEETQDVRTMSRYYHALTSAVLTARFKWHIEGRNDLGPDNR